MKNVLLICGGNSNEHNISLISAKSILENFDKNKFSITPVIIDFDNVWYEYDDVFCDINEWENKNIKIIDNIIEYLNMFDVVFPIIHGFGGEDGKLQGMLDLFNIKYVGSKTLASSVCMDKGISKMLFSYLGITQIPFLTIKDDFKIKDIVNKIGFPMIIKPANGGSSIGINLAKNKKELKKAINNAFKYDNKIIIEKFIKARELECAVLEDDDFFISDVGEIVSANEFYDYDAKYKNNESYTIVPADIEDKVRKDIQECTKLVCDEIGLHGLARIDFLYDENQGKVYLNEINTLPGFTSISMYPKLFMNDGLSYSEIITKLINNC